MSEMTDEQGNPEKDTGPVVEMGVRVRDTISGFEGVATGFAEYLSGQEWVQITPDVPDKNGRPIASDWFESKRVAVVTQKK